jgi:transposase
METRRPYPSDVTDEEWAFVGPYLTLMTPDAPQRTHDLREVFNCLRWLVRTGSPWRYLPNDLPPWEAVYQPTAVILDSRTLQSTPESGGRAGYDGAPAGRPRHARQ